MCHFVTFCTPPPPPLHVTWHFKFPKCPNNHRKLAQMQINNLFTPDDWHKFDQIKWKKFPFSRFVKKLIKLTFLGLFSPLQRRQLAAPPSNDPIPRQREQSSNSWGEKFCSKNIECKARRRGSKQSKFRDKVDWIWCDKNFYLKQYMYF